MKIFFFRVAYSIGHHWTHRVLTTLLCWYQNRQKLATEINMTNLSRERKGAKQKVRFFNDETGSIFFFGNFGDLFELTFSTNDVFQKKLNDVE